MITGIYKIESPSGRIYIGQSRDIKKRWLAHKARYKYQNQPLLHNSLNKYGPENHCFSIIHEVPNDVTTDVLNSFEQLYLELYERAKAKMLNLTLAGNVTGRASESTRKKMSEVQRELKLHVGNKYRLGIAHSADTKEKISKTRSGKYSAWNVGKEWSDEAKRKMSLARMGKEPWNKGKTGTIKHSPEEVLRISDRFKTFWEVRKSKGLKGFNVPKVKSPFYEFNGESRYLKDWCRILEIPYRLTHQRIFRDNWPPEKALSVTPKTN